MRLLDAEAQLSQLLYHHLNCVAAGLVQRPEHMPGPLLHPRMWKKGYLDVETPPVYHDGDKRPDGARVLLTPHPLAFQRFGGDLDRMLYHIDRLTEDGIRAIRNARGGRPVKGIKAVQRIHPWSEPATLRETGGQPKPCFRIGARGIVAKQANIEAALETRAHRKRYTQVRLARKQGIDERYPYGTYAQVVIHGQPMEPVPTLGQLVTQPGPLLEDVQAQLGRSPITLVERRELSIPLIEEVRSAITEQAADIVEEAEVEFATRVGVQHADASKDTSANSTDRTDLVVRRRRTKHLKHNEHAARRVVVLRDRRLGRPTDGSGRSGTDPPS